MTNVTIEIINHLFVPAKAGLLIISHSSCPAQKLNSIRSICYQGLPPEQVEVAHNFA
jgi:hypothetical protein